MARVALKLVQSPSHEVRQVSLWRKEEDEKGHSLHYLVSYPGNFPWSFANFFIQKYTQKGELVLDPFCSTGSSVLESALLGRVGYGVDTDPLAVKIARAKISPCDITEVTLKVQEMNLSRPTALDRYRNYFSQFYDVDTYRELVCLKSFLEKESSNQGQILDHSLVFIEALALSLLHGHSAGYFSTYTYPQLALSPKEQFELNMRRGQTPDYRPVAPRLLRRVAMATTDGVPVALRLRPSPHRVLYGDARDLSSLNTASVSLVLTSIPYPQMRDLRPEQWLKVWFSGLEEQQAWHPQFESLESWSDYMNEVLLELARVTRPGGRAVLDTRRITYDNQEICLDHELVDLVEKSLDRYWAAEQTLVQEAENTLTSVGTSRTSTQQGREYRALILRRK